VSVAASSGRLWPRKRLNGSTSPTRSTICVNAAPGGAIRDLKLHRRRGPKLQPASGQAARVTRHRPPTLARPTSSSRARHHGGDEASPPAATSSAFS
jgi:hypothetical protein